MCKVAIHAIVKYMSFLKKLSAIVLAFFISTTYASDGRIMTDTLTCYNYEKRIVFILDLEKDNEKLNNMNLAAVSYTHLTLPTITEV